MGCHFLPPGALSQSRDRTHISIISCIGKQIPYHCAIWEAQIFAYMPICKKGFPGSSTDEESACNAGDPVLIPGLGRSAGEGISYPLQYSRASQVALMVKNPPAKCRRHKRQRFDPWVGKIPWRRKRLPTPLAWRIPWTV